MKKSKLSLVALILGVLALLFEFTALSNASSSATSSAAKLGVAIGMSIVLPSVVAMAAAVVLNAVGYLKNHRTITLISAILYTVAFVLMPLWGFVGIPSMILQFIAFTKMPKSE